MSNKIKKQCEDPRKAQKEYGVRIEEVTDYHGKQKRK